LAKYGKGVSHMAVKIYNALPSDLKENFSMPNIFKSKLKDFLYNSFYTLDEFFNRSIYCYKDLLSAITNDHLYIIDAIDGNSVDKYVYYFLSMLIVTNVPTILYDTCVFIVTISTSHGNLVSVWIYGMNKLINQSNNNILQLLELIRGYDYGEFDGITLLSLY
jgi:hypothetical protein